LETFLDIEEEIEQDLVKDVALRYPPELRISRVLLEMGDYDMSVSHEYLTTLLREWGFSDPEAIIERLKSDGYIQRELSYTKQRYHITYKGAYKAAEGLIMDRPFHSWTLAELNELKKYVDMELSLPERGYFLKDELVKEIKQGTHQQILRGFLECKEIAKDLTNREKQVIYLVGEYVMGKDKVLKIMGSADEVNSLIQKNVLHTSYHDGELTLDINWYSALDSLNELKRIKHIQLPMEKAIPDNIMRSAVEIAKNEDKREYSIAIDFERHLEYPERLVALKGGRSKTFRLDDFELFGHTHPNRNRAFPSLLDLETMHIARPEFIVAGITGEIMFFNVKDPKRYIEFSRRGSVKARKDLYHDKLHNLDLTKLTDRDEFFKHTGIEVMPYEKDMTIRMVDDLVPDKQMPTFSKHSLVKLLQEKDEPAT